MDFGLLLYQVTITVKENYFQNWFHLGGADEGMIGHENAYKVYWPKKSKISFDKNDFF